MRLGCRPCRRCTDDDDDYNFGMHALQIRRGLAAVDNWKREMAVTFTADEIAEVDALLHAAGVGLDHEPWGHRHVS